MRHCTLVLLALAFCFTGISQSDEKAAPTAQGSPYLFVWAGDAARQSSDFLAVIDANPSSSNYGRIVSNVPASATATMPHHTEYEFPPDNLLFADGWVAGRGGAVTVAALVATMLLAAVSFHGMERPILRWGHRFRFQKKTGQNETVDAALAPSKNFS